MDGKQNKHDIETRNWLKYYTEKHGHHTLTAKHKMGKGTVGTVTLSRRTEEQPTL